MCILDPAVTLGKHNHMLAVGQKASPNTQRAVGARGHKEAGKRALSHAEQKTESHLSAE